MKKFIAILAGVVMVLLLASPVLAVSLGISPSHTELEVPGNGSATASFQVHYFSGDLKVSLVDIPLTVEPETLHVEASSEPVDIELTIYGDESLGSQVYDGYIRFLGMSGGSVGVAVKVKAEVTNIVEGQPVPEEPSQEILPAKTPPEESAPKQAPPAPTPPPEQAPPAEAPAPEPAPSPEQALTTTELPILPLAGIAAATAIFITLIVVLAGRRRRY